jgi:hypothetical protein
VRSRWGLALAVLLGAHVAVGIARIPSKVWGERAEEIARYRDAGAVRFHLDNRERRGADAVQAVLDQSPENAVVLWRGAWRGALEFAPALLAPRVLVHELSCAPDAASLWDRPIARGRLADGRAGVLVLVGAADRIELALR